MKSVILVCLFLGILAVSCAFTVSAQEKDPCADPQTQTQINTCAAEQYSKADADLNKVYSEIMSRLNCQRKAQLKAVQFAWIKFRDAHCQFANAELAGKSMYPTLQYGCLTSLTKTRTEQLNEILENSR